MNKTMTYKESLQGAALFLPGAVLRDLPKK